MPSLIDILYKAEPDPNPGLQQKWTLDLQEKRTLHQNLLYELKTHFLTNLRLLISNMTIVFLKSLPKNTQIRHFWSQIQVFLFFRKILQLDKFEGADFKYDNSIFKIVGEKYPIKAFLVKNTQIRHFWSQIQVFLFFRKILQLDKFEGADFKYDNSIFKILAQKYPNKAFLVKNSQIRHFWFQIQAFLFFRKILQLH